VTRFHPSTQFRLVANPAAARANRVLGIALTKDAKYRKALDKAKKHQDAYLRCKARRKAKGKAAWPVDKGKALSGNCRHDYELWQHFEEKAADRARELKAKLQKQGKLSPQMANELNQAMAAPSNAVAAEYNKDKADWQKDQAGKGGGKGKGKGKGATEEPVIDDYSAEAATDYTIPILVGGGLLLLVGGAFILLRKKKSVSPTTTTRPVVHAAAV